MLSSLLTHIKSVIHAEDKAAIVAQQLIDGAEDFTLSTKMPVLRDYIAGVDALQVISHIGLDRCAWCAQDTLFRVDNTDIARQVQEDQLIAACLYLECLPFVPFRQIECVRGDALLCSALTLATWYVDQVDILPPNMYRPVIVGLTKPYEQRYCLDGFSESLESWYLSKETLLEKDEGYLVTLKIAMEYNYCSAVKVGISRLWYIDSVKKGFRNSS
jgi:hypothetical protein